MPGKEVVESLNKISSNLAEVNSTLKVNNNEKVENLVNYNEMVKELIEKIDTGTSLFTRSDELHGQGITLWLISVYIALVAFVLAFSVGTLIQNITFAIAVGALLVGFVSFSSRSLEKNVIEANFGKISEKFNIDGKDEEKSLILLALLKMKVVTPHRKLGIVKKMHPEMFTKENLLQKLYE